MNLFGITEKSLQIILDVFKSCSEIDSAKIFGSRAKGNFKSGSDIDIALFGKVSVREISDLVVKLNEQSSIPYSVDLVAYDLIETPDLKEHIDRVGIELYRKSPVVYD